MISRSGTASQSSIDWDGLASRAIDGNTSGLFESESITHTLKETNPWWMLELDKEYTISEIVVFNRRGWGGWGTRLTFFRLTVFRNGAEVFTYNDNASPAALVTSIPMTSKVIGDTVMIQLLGDDRILSLAEVEVYGGNVLPTAFPSSVPSDIPSSIPSVTGPQPLETADVSDFTLER